MNAVGETTGTEQAERGTSLWRDAWQRLGKNKMAVISAVILVLIMLASFIGPFFLKLSYETQNLQLGAVPPGVRHWLGTDTLGRDLFVRILYGGRVSMSVGFCATAVALIIGVFYGAISGFLGGKIDMLMMRIVDIRSSSRPQRHSDFPSRGSSFDT